MEDREERALLMSVKKWLIGFFLSSVLGLTGFYFNTTFVQAQNTSKIEKLESEVKKVTTVPVLNQNKIKNIEKDVARIEKNQLSNHKENKEAQKEMRKEMQKMLELLYQIRNQNN